MTANAYESTDDPDLALGMFRLRCGRQEKTFWLQFRRQGGSWLLVPPADDATTHLRC